MSVRALASELYRSMKRVEDLERKLADLSENHPDRTKLKEELLRARRERDQLRGALEGSKG